MSIISFEKYEGIHQDMVYVYMVYDDFRFMHDFTQYESWLHFNSLTMFQVEKAFLKNTFVCRNISILYFSQSTVINLDFYWLPLGLPR